MIRALRKLVAELARWNWLFIAVWGSLIALSLFTWWVLWAFL